MTKSGEYFRIWRKNNGFTGIKIAEKLGCIQQHVSNIESGKMVISEKLLLVISKMMSTSEYKELIELTNYDNSPVPIQKKLDEIHILEQENLRLRAENIKLLEEIEQLKNDNHELLKRLEVYESYMPLLKKFVESIESNAVK